MDAFDIAAGVWLGIVLAAAFLWCCRHLDVKDATDAPWWAIVGFLFILAMVSFQLHSSRTQSLLIEQTAAEYLQEARAPAD